MSIKTQPANNGKPWTSVELVLAFDLYCRIPIQKTKANNPEMKKLAKLLQRSPASVARKIDNLGSFDPELKQRNISGLCHGSKLNRQVWDEFHETGMNWRQKRPVQAGSKTLDFALQRR